MLIRKYCKFENDNFEKLFENKYAIENYDTFEIKKNYNDLFSDFKCLL